MNTLDLDTMLVEWQCQALVTRSMNLLDKGCWQALSQCYTDEAVLFRPSAPSVPIQGREAILKSFMARPLKETCHALSNMEVSVLNNETAIVTSRVVLFSGEEKAHSIESVVLAKSDVYIGRFTDELKKVEGKWLISKRQGSIELNYKGV